MAGRSLRVEIIGDASSLNRALGQAQRSTSKFGGYLKAALGTAALAGAAALGTAGVASVKMAIDFDASMTKIKALVGASDLQMEEYKKGVLDLAKTVPIGPKALADALYFVTSAGFKGAKALDVLRASAQASAAGLGDTQIVADAVTSAVNAYGESSLKASRATDILLATVREGKAEPEELAASIGRVIAPAEAMGVAFDEVGGSVAALSLTGLDAAEAVTALRGILSSLLKPSAEAVTFLDSAGISMKNLREQIDQKGLLTVLQNLRDRFGDNKEALAKLFPNMRALNGFLALTGRNAEKNAEVMQRVTSATGDTQKAFEEASKSAQFQLNKAWSQIQVAMIQFGSVALPLVIRGIKRLGPLMEQLGKFVAMVRMRWSQFNAMLERHRETVNQVTRALSVLAKALGLLARWEIFLYGTILRVWMKILDVTLTVTGGIIGAVRRVIGFFRSLGGAAQRAGGVVAAGFRIMLAPIFTVIAAVQRLINLIRSIPSPGDIVGGITGKVGDIAGHIPGFASGGVVPGRRGAPRLIMAHGGETVLPTHRGVARTGSVNVIVLGGDREAIEYLRQLDIRQSRRSGRGLL